jgi:hypothetical protein
LPTPAYEWHLDMMWFVSLKQTGLPGIINGH